MRIVNCDRSLHLILEPRAGKGISKHNIQNIQNRQSWWDIGLLWETFTSYNKNDLKRAFYTIIYKIYKIYIVDRVLVYCRVICLSYNINDLRRAFHDTIYKIYKIYKVEDANSQLCKVLVCYSGLNLWEGISKHNIQNIQNRQSWWYIGLLWDGDSPTMRLWDSPLVRHNNLIDIILIWEWWFLYLRLQII